MNKIVEKGYVENMLNSVDYLDYEASKKITSRLVYEIIKSISLGNFSRYGEILNYNLDDELIDGVKSKADYDLGEGINDISMSFVVIKLKNKIIVKVAEEAEKFYGFAKLGETVGYIEDDKVWISSRSDEYIENGLIDLKLIFINTLYKDIYKNISKFVCENFETFVDGDSIKNKIESYKEDMKRYSKSSFTVMSRFEDELKFKFKAKDLDDKDALLTYIDMYHKDIISELSNKVSLASKKLFEDEDDMVTKYLDSNDEFWSIVKNNVSDIIVNKVLYEYSEELLKLDKVRDVISNLDKYNLAKKLNNITQNVLRDINKSIESQSSSVKTIVYKTEVSEYSVPAEFCTKSKCVNLSEIDVFLSTIAVDDRKYDEKVFGYEEIHVFELKYRKKTIFKLEESIVDRYKEILDLLKEVA